MKYYSTCTTEQLLCKVYCTFFLFPRDPEFGIGFDNAQYHTHQYSLVKLLCLNKI